MVGIIGYFTFETAYYYHPAAGRNLFLFVRNGQAGVTDLVGISDYREVIACLVGYVFLKESEKKADTLC